MTYFAYGSNLCTDRLRKRVPSARVVARAKLLGYKLCFHKRSKDGSGKANAYKTEGHDYVWGVVFEVLASEKQQLDQAEGHGYKEVQISVSDETGKTYSAFTYVADEASIDSSLQPYSWYLRFIKEGAMQYDLPTEYIQSHIDSVRPIEDTDRKRDATNRAICC